MFVTFDSFGVSCVYISISNHLKAELYSNAKHFFHYFLTCAFMFLEVISIYPTDRYQNAIPRVMLLHELKKFNFKSVSHLMTHNFVGHLKTLYMSILLLSGGVKSDTAERWEKYQSFNMNPASFLIWVMVEWYKTSLCAPVMWQPREKGTCL